MERINNSDFIKWFIPKIRLMEFRAWAILKKWRKEKTMENYEAWLEEERRIGNAYSILTRLTY